MGAAEAPPPAPIIQTSIGDITISLQKQVVADSPIQKVFGSKLISVGNHKIVELEVEEKKETVKPHQAQENGTGPVDPCGTLGEVSETRPTGWRHLHAGGAQAGID